MATSELGSGWGFMAAIYQESLRAVCSLRDDGTTPPRINGVDSINSRHDEMSIVCCRSADDCTMRMYCRSTMSESMRTPPTRDVFVPPRPEDRPAAGHAHDVQLMPARLPCRPGGGPGAGQESTVMSRQINLRYQSTAPQNDT